MSEVSGEPGVGAPAARSARSTPGLSPRISMLLVGGVALGGLAWMCALVAMLAIWRAS